MSKVVDTVYLYRRGVIISWGVRGTCETNAICAI